LAFETYNDWVEQITGLNFDFLQHEGYVCTQTLPITIIDKSCSGLNFWLMAFLLGAFILQKKATDFWRFFTVLLVFLVWLGSLQLLQIQVEL